MDGSRNRPDASLGDATFAGVRWLGIARLFAETAAFASMVTLAHLISPAEFGRAAIALIVPALALVLAGDGLGTPLVQRRAVRTEHLEATMLAALVCGAALTGATFLLAPVVSDSLFDERTGAVVQLASPAFLLAAVGTVPQATLQRELDFRRISTIEIGALAAGSAISILLAVSGLDAEAVVLGALGTTAVSTLALLASTPLAFPRWRPDALRELAAFGIPAALAALVHTGFRNVDYVILGAKLGAAQLGFYWRAFQLGVEYQRKVSSIMARVALPVYSRSETMERMRALRSRIVRVQATVIVPALALLMAVGPVLIPWLFGDRWQPSVVPAQILAGAGMAVALYTGTGPLLLAAGRPSAMLAFNLVRLAIYAAAVLFAAPHGLTAVSIAVTAVMIAQLVAAQHLLLGRLMGIPMRSLWHDAGPAVVSSVALLVVAVPLTRLTDDAGLPAPLTVLVAAGAGTGAYLAALRALFRPAWGDLDELVRRTLARPGRSRQTAGSADPIGHTARDGVG